MDAGVPIKKPASGKTASSGKKTAAAAKKPASGKKTGK